jgi:hypothetical protein
MQFLSEPLKRYPQPDCCFDQSCQREKIVLAERLHHSVDASFVPSLFVRQRIDENGTTARIVTWVYIAGDFVRNG